MAKVSTDESKSSKRGPANTDVVRAQLSRAFSVIGGVFAAILALGALIVALRSNINLDNGLVKLIRDLADFVATPLFSIRDGIFTFDGKNALTKAALVNWGIAAIVWLIVGRVLSNLVAPKGKSK